MSADMNIHFQKGPSCHQNNFQDNCSFSIIFLLQQHDMQLCNSSPPSLPVHLVVSSVSLCLFVCLSMYLCLSVCLSPVSWDTSLLIKLLGYLVGGVHPCYAPRPGVVSKLINCQLLLSKLDNYSRILCFKIS